MLTIENAIVRAGDVKLLDRVSLSVADAQVLALLGPSGSGKTTLLRTIAGLQPLSSGRVMWDGDDITTVPPERRGIGLMFQDHALFPHCTVAENVAFGLRMRKDAKGAIGARVDEMLDLVQLSGFGARRVDTLSGGEQQRVALARSLAPAPRLLLLDEPFGSLDRSLRAELLIDMQRLLRQFSITAIAVTHDHEEAFTLGDSVAILESGRVVRQGSAPGVWRDPGTEFAARFLGFDTVDGVVEGTSLRTPWGDVRAPIRWPEGPVRFAVPPHAVSVDSSGSVHGTVTARVFRGAIVELHLATTTTVALRAIARAPGPSVGAEINVTISPDELALLDEQLTSSS